MREKKAGSKFRAKFNSKVYEDFLPLHQGHVQTETVAGLMSNPFLGVLSLGASVIDSRCGSTVHKF